MGKIYPEPIICSKKCIKRTTTFTFQNV